MERIGTDTLHFPRQRTMQRRTALLALPLGELSPQVTERVLPPFLNQKIKNRSRSVSVPTRSLSPANTLCNGVQPPLALPLGELSPQVTERVLPPFLNHKINLCTHTTKIPVDLPVGESQNLQTKSHQELRTFRIISKPLGFIMLRSIQFNDQSGRSTVKVHDESADNPLFVNLYRIFAQKKIPELPFVGRHLPAKPPGIF